MPAVPLVMGVTAISSGAAAFGATALFGSTMLGSIAAGASVLGGAAMVAGAIKGGGEGQKWISTGGLLALGGSLGTSFGTKVGADVATKAGTDAAANAATEAAKGAPGSATDALIKGADPTAAQGIASDPIAQVSKSADLMPKQINLANSGPVSNPLNATAATQPAAGTFQVAQAGTAIPPSVQKAVDQMVLSNPGMDPQVAAAKILAEQQKQQVAATKILAEQQKQNNLLTVAGGILQGQANEQQMKDQQAYMDKRFQQVQYRPI